MKTYYSPYRWWLVGAVVVIPLVSFVNNALKRAGDLTGFAIYLVGGVVLGFVAYGIATSLKMVPLISVENGVITYQRYRKATSFELANLERVERNSAGAWQAVLRKPVATGEGQETSTVLFAYFNSWRKTHWREAFGADANIVV